MGMHFGILAANAPWPLLHEKLSRRVGELRAAGPATDLEKIQADHPDCFVLLAGEYAGKAYVADSSFMVSVAYPDLIVALSSDIGDVVVGCGAETVSGSFDLILADRSELKRLFHHCHMEISRAFELGQPLSCESSVSYEQLDGDGLFAALREAGFDYQNFSEKGTHSCYLFRPEDDMFKEIGTGPLGKRLQEHKDRFKWPPGQAPQPMLVRRTLGPQPVGFWSWLRSIFGKR